MVARIRPSGSRRLAGFRFEAEPPVLPEILPRMDIAVFVGFAAAGPLDLPVAVEDAAQFAAIFGSDAPLAWDVERGERVSAYLGPAVRAFFRNGGQRCWVLRVADTASATANLIPIPGLAEVRPSGKVIPAFARARAVGSWSDGLQVSSALGSERLQFRRGSLRTRQFDLVPATPNGIAAGDLLRFSFDEGFVLYVPVASTRPGPASIGSRSVLRVVGGRGIWFEQPRPPRVSRGVARTFAPHASRRLATAWVPDEIVWQANAPVVVDLDLELADAPALGSALRVTFGSEQLWITVQAVTSVEGGSPPRSLVRVTGEGLYRRRGAPRTLPRSQPAVERLHWELWVREGAAAPVRLPELGFVAEHRRFWGALPADDELYAPRDTGETAERPALWIEAAEPRFPLAGMVTPDSVYVPLGMAALPEHFLSPFETSATALERDGLATFDARLFLDPALVGVGTANLLNEADFVRYLSSQPRALRGLHAALGVEEATIVAVPDAVHRGWTQAVDAPPQPPEPSPPLPRPEWWPFLPCDLAGGELAETLRRYTSPRWHRYLDAHPEIRVPLADEPLWEHFLDCDLRIVAPPLLLARTPDSGGSFGLRWTSAEAGSLRYVLQEARRPDWSDAAEIWSGRDEQITIRGRSQGDFYYRVRVEADNVSSDWSNGVVVRVAPPGRWQHNDPSAFRDDTLMAIQRAALRLCAARGDMLAVLALPAHYREDRALAHVAVLKSPSAPAIPVGERLVLPLSAGEAQTLSFGALYHPWLLVREAQAAMVRHTPPDGSASGIIAGRARLRGAWIAPANEALRDVVALDPRIDSAHWQRLLDAQLNTIRHEPRGFMALSADTLSDDPDLRPISVRRLLSLLRRLALRHGATYVFEPHSPAFRRLVQRRFDGLLGTMWERGAFAGRVRAEGFRVVTDETVNSPTGVDSGRFVVELRVAPSQPLAFLTVRLVQTGDRGSVSEGR